MKIYIPQRDRDVIGGGFTFNRNIQKALKYDVQFVDKLEDCDIYFIAGATMAERVDVKWAKAIGKKIILRVDNIPRNSRNRNTGTSRLFDFAQMADVVIYQSQWAKKWIEPFIKRDGEIILNGTDDEIFNEEGPKKEKEGTPQYLYSKYSSDPVKLWERAWYDFQRIYYENPNAHLWLIGRAKFFGLNQLEYHFDFFGGAEKRYRYLGFIKNRDEMAEIYRGTDFLLMPYYLDACSNVVVEAKMCGVKIICEGDEDNSALEILQAPREDLTLKGMGQKYLKVFKEVLK